MEFAAPTKSNSNIDNGKNLLEAKQIKAKPNNIEPIIIIRPRCLNVPKVPWIKVPVNAPNPDAPINKPSPLAPTWSISCANPAMIPTYAKPKNALKKLIPIKEEKREF